MERKCLWLLCVLLFLKTDNPNYQKNLNMHIQGFSGLQNDRRAPNKYGGI